jgi:hypothetical protein
MLIIFIIMNVSNKFYIDSLFNVYYYKYPIKKQWKILFELTRWISRKWIFVLKQRVLISWKLFILIKSEEIFFFSSYIIFNIKI